MFSDGKRNGQGKFIAKDSKEIVVAEWLNDIKEGNGKIFYPNGKIKMMRWKYDKPY